MLRDGQDAYGHLIWDYWKTGTGLEVVERDDGLIDPSNELPGYYFADYGRWFPRERRAMRCVRGKVLDAGCGAGRVALHLQRKGFDVLGVDLSPLAIQVCKERGLKRAMVLPIAHVGKLRDKFDTILMFCNNFGLLGGYEQAKKLLRTFFEVTTPDARIIAESTDPKSTNPFHRAYQRRNRLRGWMPGQVRIRYQTYKTPWFDYLLASRNEMRRLVAGTGWHIEHFINSPKPNPHYIAVIGKVAR